MLSWTLHQKGSPKGDGAAVAVRHQLYYFGRRTEKNYQTDVQVFNTVTLLWKKLALVTSRRGHWVPSRYYGYTAVLIEDIVYFWGGREYYRDEYGNELYAFDVDAHTWFKPQVSGTVPEGRGNHSACVLGKVMFIHGGLTRESRYINDMSKLDTSTMVWSLIKTRGTPLPASSHHSATIIGTKTFVFGGGANSSINTIRVFDTETNHWLSTPSTQPLPEERDGHSAFTYNGELYIFGGSCEDMWKFSPETFCWKKVEPKGKGPSQTYNMCCCMVGDRIILFGGDYTPDVSVLDLSPSLKTLCKLTVIQYGLDQSGLPHNIRWELAAMTSNSN